MCRNPTWTQAKACRETDVCPMKLSRHIKDLKQSNVYTSFLDAIVKEIEAELAATPPPAPAPAAAEPGAVPPPTPPSAAELLEMVRARATRLGDGRPFGAHGTVGEYRETVKAVTKLMDDKVLTPSGKTGSKLAAEIGVKIGPRRLHDLAKKAPGESPPSSAAPLKLGKETEHSLREYIMTLEREADIVETKEMIKSEINNTIAGTPLALTFPDGKVTDKVYYAFLDRCDLYTGDQVPLEDKRSEWEHSTNAETQYKVWAELFVAAGLAVRNPTFDPTICPPDPRSVPIHWKPGAEDHVASYDETDVRADQTKKGRASQHRAVRAAAPGSRREHGGATSGRGKKNRAKGWVGGKEIRKKAKDQGAVISVKGGTKFSFAGGSLMNGKVLPTLIISDKKLDALKIDLEKYSPACDLVGPDGTKLVSRFIHTPSGGMETDTVSNAH